VFGVLGDRLADLDGDDCASSRKISAFLLASTGVGFWPSSSRCLGMEDVFYIKSLVIPVGKYSKKSPLKSTEYWRSSAAATGQSQRIRLHQDLVVNL
jgi:hypothetical protein